MRSRINLSFDVEIASLGDAVAAISELVGIPVQNIAMREAKSREIAAVAEIIPAPKALTKAEIIREGKQRKPTRSMPRVSFTLGDAHELIIPGRSVAMRNTRYCRLADLLKARTLKEVSWGASDADTIICPADGGAIQKAFIGEHQWNGVRGTAERVSKLKYAAAYETAKKGGRSSLVCYAEILKSSRR